MRRLLTSPCQHRTGRLDNWHRSERPGPQLQRQSPHGESHPVSLLTRLHWHQGPRTFRTRLLTGLFTRRWRASACVRCSASSSSSEPSSAQPASTSCCRRNIVAVSTAAIVASVTNMVAGTGAAEAAPRDDGAAVTLRNSARQLWELSAAAPSTSAERADLVSPTVLPQLSASERQVRTVDLLRQESPCSRNRMAAAQPMPTGAVASAHLLPDGPHLDKHTPVADVRLPGDAEDLPEAILTRRSWSTTSAYSGRTASRGTSRSLSGKASQSR